MSRRIVIIGAGPGGLAASLLLSKAGFEVTVLERMARVGGRCSALEVDGFRFDRGPTFFLYPRILSEIYRLLGRDLFKDVPMTRLDPQYRLVFGDGSQIQASPNQDRMQDQIRHLNSQDAERLPLFLKDARTKLSRFAPILESPFQGWRDLLRPMMLGALPYLRPFTSLEKDLRRFFHDERVRLAFSFQSKYLGMSPFECPSLFTILSFLEYEHGVYHPQGGCSAVSENMAELARSMGVQFHLEEEVQELLFSGRRPSAVRTGRRVYGCDALVINADFARAMKRLVPEELRPRWNDRKLARSRYSCSTYMLYLGVRGPVDAAHHTIYFSSDYQGNLDDITRHKRISADPSFYLANPCVTDPGMAPDGCSALYLLIPVPHMSPGLNWQVAGPQLRSLAFQQLRKLGLDDLEGRIVCERSFSPQDWQDQMEVFRGATFSLAHNLGQMLHMRPRNRFDDLDSVYLVGGGTHPGSGLPVIYSSARITSELICRDLGRPPVWVSPARA